MASTKCISANAIKNNGSATIANAGAVPTSNTLTQDFSQAELNTLNKSNYGSHVTRAVAAASSGNLGTGKCLSGGAFSYIAANKYIIPQVSTTIAGVASTILANNANRIQQRSLNKVETVHTAYLTALSWTGGFDGLPHYSTTVSAQAPSFGADREATTIGQFCIRTGKPLPVQMDYTQPYST